MAERRASVDRWLPPGRRSPPAAIQSVQSEHIPTVHPERITNVRYQASPITQPHPKASSASRPSPTARSDPLASSQSTRVPHFVQTAGLRDELSNTQVPSTHNHLITSSRKADAPSVAPASSQPSSHELLMLFSSKFEKTLQARMEELKKQLDDHTAESQYGKQEKCRRERTMDIWKQDVLRDLWKQEDELLMFPASSYRTDTTNRTNPPNPGQISSTGDQGEKSKMTISQAHQRYLISRHFQETFSPIVGVVGLVMKGLPSEFPGRTLFWGKYTYRQGGRFWLLGASARESANPHPQDVILDRRDISNLRLLVQALSTLQLRRNRLRNVWKEANPDRRKMLGEEPIREDQRRTRTAIGKDDL